MSYSAELIEKIKTEKGFSTDAQVVDVLPKMTKGNLSQVKSGARHLTEEQALWIAEQCQLDAKLVLVELAEECAKSDAAKQVWHALAKKMKAAASVLALTGLLLVSSISGGIYAQRRKYPIMYIMLNHIYDNKATIHLHLYTPLELNCTLVFN